MYKKNKKTILFSVLIIPTFFSSLFAASGCGSEKPQPVTLEFWGVFDDSAVIQPLISQFRQQYSYFTVNYHKKNIATYENDLIDALAAGRGPDIFSFHNTWLPKHIDKLAAAPETMITSKKVKDAFVDVVEQDFISDNKVYALPLSVDSLALFYNKDLLNSKGIANPPANWAEFNTDVKKLTQRDDKNNILLAGAALGTAKNINRSTDVLAMLMMQNGAKMVQDDKNAAAFDRSSTLASGQFFNPGENALIFYTNFANPVKEVYTWNQYQHYSIDAFVEGKAAMMLNYSYQIPVIQARSPHLNFDVAPLPQIAKDSRVMTFANYWGLAVSKTSGDKSSYAWKFIDWITSDQSALKKYLETAQKPTARRDLIDWQKNDESLGVFAQQSLIAKSWWEVDSSAIETIFAQMIEAVSVNRKAPLNALQDAAQQITLLMQKAKSK